MNFKQKQVSLATITPVRTIMASSSLNRRRSDDYQEIKPIKRLRTGLIFVNQVLIFV